MRIPPESALRVQPWTWLLKAVAAGGIPTGLLTLYFGGRDPRTLVIATVIGCLFSVLIWGGYECATEWLEDHPATCSPYQAALLILGKWSLLYFVLVGVGVLLVRILLGVNCFQDRQSAFYTLFLGLVISGPIVNLKALSRMVAAARALEQSRAQASFLALKAQFSPHTLFNALNTIAALIPVDPRAAEETVQRLSALLRRILAALERERWSLTEEFRLLQDLLEIQRARFGERLQYDLHLPEAEEDVQIPPLLLLPLVENSLKHGFGAKVGLCHLSIRAEDRTIRILDDGVGRPERVSEGIGIRTVRQRLAAMGGRLDWPETQAGCLVEVRLCP